MEYTVLSNNLRMPMAGFGVFQVTDKEECKQSVLSAIRTGYRLIDTAAVYGNEDAVGDAVREAIAEGLCTREELFITSKLWVQDMASFFWSEEEINNRMDKIMTDAMVHVWEKAAEKSCSLRTAAYIVACERILLARKDRGIYPG